MSTGGRTGHSAASPAASTTMIPTLAFGQARHAVGVQQLVGELPVAARNRRADQGLKLLRVLLLLSLVPVGDDDIDPIWLVSHVLVDPVELDLQLIGVKTHGAEHAETTAVGNRCHYVPAVGEREHRKVDTQFLRQCCLHEFPLFLTFFPGPCPVPPMGPQWPPGSLVNMFMVYLPRRAVEY